jgi:PAS domain S-box-containing protein
MMRKGTLPSFSRSKPARPEISADLPIDSNHLSPHQTNNLIHELQVRQIELKMQNEELRRTQAELEASYARYFDLYDLAPVGYISTDENGLILESNLFAATMLDVPNGMLVNQPLTRFIIIEDQDLYYKNRKQLFGTGGPRILELRLLKKDGSRFWVRLDSTVVQVADGMAICHVMVSDITERRRAEDRETLTREVLELLNRTGDTTGTISDILKLVKKGTGFEAVGIRLREGGDYPYYETNGFPGHFVESERYLCAYDEGGNIIRDNNGNPVLECMCGNIIKGRTDPAKPFFTEGGSFWSNCTTELLASTTEKDRQARTRNQCNGEGYESVALIPLHSGNEIVGLLQLNDRRKDQFNIESIQFFEGLGAAIGIALARKWAGKTLLESEERYRRITEGLSDYLYTVQIQDGRVVKTTHNIACKVVTGYSAAELASDPYLWINMIPEQERGLVLEHVRNILLGKEMPAIEHRIVRKDGAVRWVSDTPIRKVDAQGILLSYDGVIEDITGKKWAEESLKESEEKFSKAFQTSPYAITITHAEDGRFVEVNDAFTAIAGFSREEALADSSIGLKLWVNEEDRQRVVNDLRAGKAVNGHEFQFRTKSGKNITGLFSAQIIKLSSGNRILSSINDITKRKQAEEDLVFKNIILSTQQDASIDGILVVDGNGRMISFNRRFVDMWSIPQEVIESKSDECALQSVIDKLADPEEFMGKVKHLYEAQKEISRDDITLKDGRMFDRYSAPMLGAGGKYYGRVWYFRDITERKRAEEKLRKSHAKYRELYENLIDAFVIVDMSGRFIEFNQIYCAMLGYSAEEIYGLTYVDLTPEKWHAIEKQIVENQVLQRGYSDVYEKEYRRKDGTVFPIELRTILLRDDAGNPSGMWGIIRDISKRKQAEGLLQESESKFSMAFQTSPYAITITHAEDGRFIEVNNAFTAIAGFTGKEALANSSIGLKLWVNEADRRQVLDDLRAGRVVVGREYQFRKKSGAIITGLFSAQTIRLNCGNCVLSSINDITERKLAEEKQKKLEDQLRQSQKLEAIGQLSSGVAHDFNNLLGGIMGHAELLKMNLAPESPLLHHPEVIISACEKAADLTRQLLSFARKAPVELKKVDLNAFLKQVVGLMDRTIDRRIEIVTDIPEQPAFILGDRNQLENALLNIAINARDAMPEGGQLCISLKTVDLNQAVLPEEHAGIMEGPYARISIADTGTGMSKEIKDRIFEPFFTTKEVGKGTGLGLASVYGCVKQHNGYIAVDSQVGKGTKFDLYFPITTSTGPVSSLKNELLLRGKGTLLVVDDEPVFHEILTEIFTGLGYLVHCCSKGAEAVEYYREHSSAIQVVILDINMPKMSGLQCFMHLKEISPGVQVIVSSGYGANSDREAMQKQGVRMFIQKPYKAVELSMKIAELISAR